MSGERSSMHHMAAADLSYSFSVLPGDPSDPQHQQLTDWELSNLDLDADGSLTLEPWPMGITMDKFAAGSCNLPQRSLALAMDETALPLDGQTAMGRKATECHPSAVHIHVYQKGTRTSANWGTDPHALATPAAQKGHGKSQAPQATALAHTKYEDRFEGRKVHTSASTRPEYGGRSSGDADQKLSLGQQTGAPMPSSRRASDLIERGKIGLMPKEKQAKSELIPSSRASSSRRRAAKPHESPASTVMRPRRQQETRAEFMPRGLAGGSLVLTPRAVSKAKPAQDTCSTKPSRTSGSHRPCPKPPLPPSSKHLGVITASPARQDSKHNRKAANGRKTPGVKRGDASKDSSSGHGKLPGASINSASEENTGVMRFKIPTRYRDNGSRVYSVGSKGDKAGKKSTSIPSRPCPSSASKARSSRIGDLTRSCVEGSEQGTQSGVLVARLPKRSSPSNPPSASRTQRLHPKAVLLHHPKKDVYRVKASEDYRATPARSLLTPPCKLDREGAAADRQSQPRTSQQQLPVTKTTGWIMNEYCGRNDLFDGLPTPRNPAEAKIYVAQTTRLMLTLAAAATVANTSSSKLRGHLTPLASLGAPGQLSPAMP